MHTTDEQLFEQSQTLHREAQTLLLDTNLLSTFQQIGPTFMSGSYALNLMVRRDIDIYIKLADTPDLATFFRLGEMLTLKLQVLKASYSNHFIRNFPGFDHGLYWGVQIEYNGQKWKLDLWGHRPLHFDKHCAEFERLQKALEAVDRATVLRIKEALRSEEGYRNNVTGMDIYTAILTGRVRTVEQFQNWWKCQTGSS